METTITTIEIPSEVQSLIDLVRQEVQQGQERANLAMEQ
jgi:hypothetical protein